MEDDRHIWRAWADFLQRWGLREWIATLLEAAGPLALLGAQCLYVTQPFYKYTPVYGHLDQLSRMLECQEDTRAFVRLLRETSSS